MAKSIHLRDLPDDVYGIICDKQNEMKKKYCKNISRELAVTRLLRDANKQELKQEKKA